ncbi:hypothetical protein C8Q70DRAFT_1049870 [Cubamyces menziesii]|uniref:Uncharacterized protein n=1 Tax=Trametes cubensis TaxID=1111947 RepID=A0AAD7TIH9_9APHY|nr:hypothetical protein C8Q70DRAFT_1049870 [Cubamyces menziesii]KAJ8462395.1 hypothetical protein ONZ51_g10934 [Trametes cubensis]
MGSAQSLVSAAAVLAIVSAIAYGFARPGDPTASLPSSSGTQAPVASTSSKKKQKKKPATAGAAAAALSDAKESVPAEPNVVSFPTVVPGEFAPSSEPADQPQSGASTAKAAKKKKKTKKASSPVPQDAQSESSATAPESSTARKPRKSATPKPAPAAEDEGWTKVETKKKATAQRTGDAQGAASSSAPDRPQPPEISTSDAGITTSVTTGNSSPVTERTEDEAAHSSLLAESAAAAPENRRTLAEKLLPKPRKTGVEDLLEKPDYPQVARVMRIQPRPDERPAAGFSWGDYEDVDDSRVTADDADGEDDGGWGVRPSILPLVGPKQPASGPGQTPTPQTAPETLTKKQRQHAARREAEKAAKAQAEAERLATLAQHKRSLEKARMAEQAKASKKQVSGGMSAYVDENGKLVWQ